MPTVYSSHPIVPGQFVALAIDGAASTKWHPASAGVEASITVAPPNHDNVKVKVFYFDWAQAPPVSFRVEFPNGSSSDNAASPMFYNPASAIQVASQDPVALSLPFDEATVADVVPYTSNTTLLTLHQPVAVGAAGGGAMYASLRITGNQGIARQARTNSAAARLAPRWRSGGLSLTTTGLNQPATITTSGHAAAARDLIGVIFNKHIHRPRVDTSILPAAVRDAELKMYGRYMRRAAERAFARQRWG